MKNDTGYCNRASHFSLHVHMASCIDWAPAYRLEQQPCKQQHTRDLPEPSVRVTFSDGTYAELGMSNVEAASILAHMQQTLGIKPKLCNELGEPLA